MIWTFLVLLMAYIDGLKSKPSFIYDGTNKTNFYLIYKSRNISFFLGRGHGSKIIFIDRQPIHSLPKVLFRGGVRCGGWVNLNLQEPPRKL